MGVYEFVGATLVLGLGAALLTNRSPRASRIAKMAASSLVLFVAIVDQSPESYAYAGYVVAALVFSWIGDLALSFSARRAFLIGLVSFALAHVAYVVAFVARGHISVPWLAGGALMMTVVGVAVDRWLRPHRPAEMAIPLGAYIVVIGAMVAFALGSHGGWPDWRLPVAAIAFAASDILVARQQFVAESLTNRIIGLPLYFFAQVLFVLTLVDVAPVRVSI